VLTSFTKPMAKVWHREAEWTGAELASRSPRFSCSACFCELALSYPAKFSAGTMFAGQGLCRRAL
jgi:hypothetical protein